ncbi:hypothetical protein GOC74_02535 [Halomicrobium mukohataei]|uniref:Uncharacterized protein n=1 Tax=Halomicrobium mukohataei TaxID=57705 RepID=A0A847TRZ1_9EURY|nr:hypothetical protein [Halomicrobium mukohataei]NLV08812.1 hypothetical protein [Halomicrobium mukohataei]
MPSAKARIEAEFKDSRSSPDASGDNTEDVFIPSDGLEIADVLDIDYVEDAIDDGSEFRVYVSTSSEVHFSST